MIITTRHGTVDLTELTDEILPVGRFAVHPTPIFNSEGARSLIPHDWTISETETGCSIGRFGSKEWAILCCHALECLHFPEDLRKLKGNKAFSRAVTGIVEYHCGEATHRREPHENP